MVLTILMRTEVRAPQGGSNGARTLTRILHGPQNRGGQGAG